MRLLIVIITFLLMTVAAANPSGGTVREGTITFTQSGNILTIYQHSNKGIVDWQSFDIAIDETTQINQPGLHSVSLHRITNHQLTQIHGNLNSNGTVMLVNPAGIIFGAGAKVNVGSLIATTGEINNNDFMNGHYQFTIDRNSQGQIINHGQITVGDAGLAALVAPSIENHGVINANLGHIALGSGITTVDLYGDSLIHFAVAEGNSSQIKSNGRLYAPGGSVKLSVNTIQNSIENVINANGVVKANNIYMDGGDIILGSNSVIKAKNEAIVFAGHSLKAQGKLSTEPGGFIETSAMVKVELDGIEIDAGPGGKWLIDPTDIIISNANAVTYNNVLAAGTNIVIQTFAGSGNGDIILDNTTTAISWSTAAKFTLEAHRNINFNAGAMINATGSGAINLRADSDADGIGTINFAGGMQAQTNTGDVLLFYNPSISYASPDNFSANIQATGTGRALAFMLVHDINDLQSIGTDANTRAGNYALSQDIDASATMAWNSGTGFLPIGTQASPFQGNFHGNGYTISNLFSNLGATDGSLFGWVNGSSPVTIENVILDRFNISSVNSAAVLANNTSGSILMKDINISNTTIAGNDGTAILTAKGALTADNITTTLTTLTGTGDDSGGLLGEMTGTSSITNSNISVTINSTGKNVGGLIGTISTPDLLTIDQVTLNAVLTGKERVGGIIGYTGFLNNANIDARNINATLTMNPTGANTGGLIGYIFQTGASNAIFEDINLSGTINSAHSYASGLVGFHLASGGISTTTFKDISSSLTINNTANFTAGGFGFLFVDTGQTIIIDNVNVSGDITGTGNMGGLAGTITSASGTGTINVEGFHFTGDISGGNNSAAIIGTVQNTDITLNNVTLNSHVDLTGASPFIGKVTGATATASNIAIGGLVTGTDITLDPGLSGGGQLNYTSTILLSDNLQLTATSSITLNSDIDARGHNLTLNAGNTGVTTRNISNAANLVINTNGNIITGNILNAASIILQNAGINSTLTTGGTLSASGDINIDRQINLTSDYSITSSAGDISLIQDLNGAQHVSLSAPLGTLSTSNLGNIIAFPSLSINAGYFDVGSIILNSNALSIGGNWHSHVDLIFTLPITLINNTSLTSSAGIEFQDTVDGPYNLTLNAGINPLLFTNVIGGNTALNHLNINSASNHYNATVHVNNLTLNGQQGATLQGSINGDSSAHAATLANSGIGANGEFIFNGCPVQEGCFTAVVAQPKQQQIQLEIQQKVPSQTILTLDNPLLFSNRIHQVKGNDFTPITPLLEDFRSAVNPSLITIDGAFNLERLRQNTPISISNNEELELMGQNPRLLD